MDLAATTEVDVDMDSEDELIAESPTEIAGVMAALGDKTSVSSNLLPPMPEPSDPALLRSEGQRERLESFKDAKVTCSKFSIKKPPTHPHNCLLTLGSLVWNRNWHPTRDDPSI